MIDADRLDELLTRLRLTVIRDQLDSLLDEATELGNGVLVRGPSPVAGSRWSL